MPFTNTFKSLTSPVALERLDENFADLLSASSGKGDELVTTKHSAANSVSRTQHELNEVVLLSNKFATLQDALNAAAGKRLIIVPGSYSMGSTTLTVGGGTEVIAHGATFTWTGNVTGVTLGDSCKWSGGTLNGAGGGTYNAGGNAFYCYGTRGSNDSIAPTYVEGPTITDVKINGWSNAGVWLGYTRRAKIQRNWITNCGYAGIGGVSCNDAVIDANHIDTVNGSGAADWYGIFVDRLEGSETRDPRSARVKITNNSVLNVTSWEGIDTHAGEDFVIAGNTLSGCRFGIMLVVSDINGTPSLACRRVTVADNVIDGSNNGACITVQGVAAQKATGIVLKGNVCRNGGWANDTSEGAIRVFQAQDIVINGNSLRTPYVWGINLNGDVAGIVVANNEIIDPRDNTYTTPTAIRINASNVKGLIADNTIIYESSGSGTYVAVHSIGVGGSLTGLDLDIGRHSLVGLDATHLTLLRATTTGVNASGFAQQSGTATLSAGTVSVTLPKRMPTAVYQIALSTSANETMRWSSKTDTGFTITSSNGSSTASVDWTVTT